MESCTALALFLMSDELKAKKEDEADGLDVVNKYGLHLRKNACIVQKRLRNVV